MRRLRLSGAVDPERSPRRKRKAKACTRVRRCVAVIDTDSAHRVVGVGSGVRLRAEALLERHWVSLLLGHALACTIGGGKQFSHR